MASPGAVRWDLFFKDFMTLADLYHYPTKHFDFHQRQLTLGQPDLTEVQRSRYSLSL